MGSPSGYSDDHAYNDLKWPLRDSRPPLTITGDSIEIQINPEQGFVDALLEIKLKNYTDVLEKQQ